MDILEIWNWANVAVLVVGVGICVSYVMRHTDGNRPIVAWSAFVLTASVVMRVMLGLNFISASEFTQLIRPWAILVNALIPLLAISIWKKNRK